MILLLIEIFVLFNHTFVPHYAYSTVNGHALFDFFFHSLYNNVRKYASLNEKRKQRERERARSRNYGIPYQSPISTNPIRLLSPSFLFSSFVLIW